MRWQVGEKVQTQHGSCAIISIEPNKAVIQLPDGTTKELPYVQGVETKGLFNFATRRVKSKVAKAAKVKEPKAPKTPKEPKEPKEPKAAKMKVGKKAEALLESLTADQLKALLASIPETVPAPAPAPAPVVPVAPVS